MFERISIKGYRSIKKLEINDLKQFNLIIGKNNSGKTNLIEALYQAINPGNSSLLGKINLWRGLDVMDSEIWKTIFYKLDLSKEIEIKSKIDNPSRERVLTILPLLNSDGTDRELILQNHKEKDVIIKDSTSVEPETINGILLKLYYIENDKKSKTFNSRIITEKIQIDPVRDRGKMFSPFIIKNDKDYKCRSGGKIVNTETLLLDFSKRFKKIAIKKKKKELIEILKEFDPNLKDLELIGDTIYADLNYDENIPIGVMGFGFLKTLALLTDIRNEKNFILLIDEIENGLHYTNLKTMWKAVFKAASLMNNQIIATTHSFECIKAFVESFPYNEDNLRVFRIERNQNDDYKVTKYNRKDLEVYIDSKWEIR